MLACRSRAEPNSSRELFRCTRSIRPVIALARSTTSTRSSPAAKRVAGVQAEPDAELADRVPEPGQRVELAGHRVVAARGVLDEHRHREAALLLLALEELAPVVHPGRGSSPAVTCPPCTTSPIAPTSAAALGVLHHQLARRDPDAVVQRGEVDHVRGVHDHRQLATAQLRRPAGAAVGFFQPCGSARNNCTMSAPRSAAVETGSSSRTWAPMSMPASLVTGRPGFRAPAREAADPARRPEGPAVPPAAEAMHPGRRRVPGVAGPSRPRSARSVPAPIGAWGGSGVERMFRARSGRRLGWFRRGAHVPCTFRSAPGVVPARSACSDRRLRGRGATRPRSARSVQPNHARAHLLATTQTSYRLFHHQEVCARPHRLRRTCALLATETRGRGGTDRSRDQPASAGDRNPRPRRNETASGRPPCTGLRRVLDGPERLGRRGW